MNYTVRGASWKYGDVVVRSDIAAASRRLPAWAPSEPTITHMPARDEPPAAEITLERILAALQAAQQQSQRPEPRTQPSTASQSDEGSQKTSQNGC
jgi:hypothetical protein